MSDSIMSSTDSSTLQILQPLSQLITVKLNEGNYLIWKHQILAAVRGYVLEEFLTGEKEMPSRFIGEPTSINAEFIKWKKQDQLLVLWLLSSLSESLLISTVGLSTSHEIRKCLETSFSSQTKAKVLHYKEQLHQLKKNGLSMRDYLNKVKSCCDALNAAGHKVNDDDQILHIMSGLGAEYNPVIVTISSRLEAMSVMEVTSLLLTFEARLEKVNENQFS